MSMAALPLPRRTRGGGSGSLFFIFRRGAAAVDVHPRWTSLSRRTLMFTL
jgi:hypothetical protein